MAVLNGRATHRPGGTASTLRTQALASTTSIAERVPAAGGTIRPRVIGRTGTFGLYRPTPTG